MKPDFFFKGLNYECKFGLSVSLPQVFLNFRAASITAEDCFLPALKYLDFPYSYGYQPALKILFIQSTYKKKLF